MEHKLRDIEITTKGYVWVCSCGDKGRGSAARYDAVVGFRRNHLGKLSVSKSQ